MREATSLQDVHGHEAVFKHNRCTTPYAPQPTPHDFPLAPPPPQVPLPFFSCQSTLLVTHYTLTSIAGGRSSMLQPTGTV